MATRAHAGAGICRHVVVFNVALSGHGGSSYLHSGSPSPCVEFAPLRNAEYPRAHHTPRLPRSSAKPTTRPVPSRPVPPRLTPVAPTLPIVVRLVAAGNKVTYYTSDTEHKAAVELAGEWVGAEGG